MLCRNIHVSIPTFIKQNKSFQVVCWFLRQHKGLSQRMWLVMELIFLSYTDILETFSQGFF